MDLDEVLARRAQEGDEKALEALYRAHANAVYGLARRLCQSGAEAEDVMQDTFLEAARSLKQYRGDGPVVGWLKRIAARKALQRYRRPRPAEPAQDAEAEVPPLPLDARMDLEPALARLSAVSRSVVWLHDVEGCTHEEIAELMAQTPSFSKSQLARAHARLRIWLKPEDGGLP